MLQVEVKVNKYVTSGNTGAGWIIGGADRESKPILFCRLHSLGRPHGTLLSIMLFYSAVELFYFIGRMLNSISLTVLFSTSTS